MRCYRFAEETGGAMTERKPPGTSWETWIDVQVRVAREQGAFDNLPGAGKPLPNLDQEYDPLWWVKQLIQREQVSILPPSLELLRKVEKELAAIEKLDDEATVRRRVAAHSTSRSPRSTRPCWRGRRRASARWTSIGSWRVGGGPAPPILGRPPQPAALRIRASWPARRPRRCEWSSCGRAQDGSSPAPPGP